MGDGVEHKLQSVGDLQSHPRNPREITDAALIGLGHSIEEFGDVSGIVWNKRNGQLVCGHQRVKVLGDGATFEDGAVVAATGERFPVRVVDWGEEKHLAAMVAANSSHIAGDWLPELSGVLDELTTPLEGMFFDLKLDELRDDVPPPDEEEAVVP